MRSALPGLVALLSLAGCSEFVCLDESTTHRIPTVRFEYGDKVRYTYWFEDGAQRVTFEHEAIPDVGRTSVLVHIDGVTVGDSHHGAAGWAADVSNSIAAEAAYVPLALPQAMAYGAWSGAWAASWLTTRASVMVEDALAMAATRQALEEAAQAGNPDDPLDPHVLAKTLKGEKDEPAAPRPEAPNELLEATDLRDELRNQGLSLDGLKIGRVLRVVAARQPFPRDFGVSGLVHPTWIFVSPDCAACDAAMAWLDERGIGYHAMLVSDANNAQTLRDLGRRAGIDAPAVPTLWRREKLLRGFDAAQWSAELR